MVNYYISEEQRIRTLEAPVEGCWISMIRPTENEILDSISQTEGIETFKINLFMPLGYHFFYFFAIVLNPT